ncbi:MAG TPA: YgdI/YgdR family lipoprotein [Verrucomicrobiae bacterium]
MKKPLVLFSLAILALTGCRHYNVTLTNNNVITTRGKPHYLKTNDTYELKEMSGRKIMVPAFKIKEIAAH